MSSASQTDRKEFEVIAVGAGFADIGAAIKLSEAGFDFIVLEKAAQIGGVWQENNYPDCACDIPSALYSYSFAPNPNWSSFFAGQKEIQNYTLDTARKFGVSDHIQVNCELLNSCWNSEKRLWELETGTGRYSALCHYGLRPDAQDGYAGHQGYGYLHRHQLSLGRVEPQL